MPVDFVKVNKNYVKRAVPKIGRIKKSYLSGNKKRWIGARNPYALANAVALMKGEPLIDWNAVYLEKGGKQCRSLLLAQMNELAQMISPAQRELTYSLLFRNDPNVRSPVFMLKHSMKMVKVADLIVGPSLEPGSLIDGGDSVADDDERKPEALPPGCTGDKDHWGKCLGMIYIKGKYGMGVQANPPTNNVKPDPAMIVDDTVQGFSLDCWLFSALSAVSWNNPSFAVATPIDDPNDSSGKQGTRSCGWCNDGTGYVFSVQLYQNTQNGWVSTKYPVADDLMLDPSNALVTARSSTLGETWPAIYEKAYALHNNAYYTDKIPQWTKKDRTNSYDLDLTLYPAGNPFNALEHLTKNSATQVFTSRTDQGGQTLSAGITAYDHLIQAYTTGDAKQDGTVHQFTKYPSVAYTYVDNVQANSYKRWGSNVDYCNEIVAANHSYAVLGIYFNDTICLQDNPDPAAKGKFIILRNPWGRLWGAEVTQLPDLKNAIITDPAITWNPKVGTTRVFSRQFYNPAMPIDGLFALRADKFDDYFESFGWVV